jgi:hypothetical protein
VAGCELGSDDFNRADSEVNEIGPKWEALSGEWRIDDNKLVCDTPGVLATTICHPSAYPLGSFWAEFQLLDLRVGVTHKVRAGHPTSSTYEVWFEPLDKDLATERIKVTVKGDETAIFEYPWPSSAEGMYARICYAPGLMLSAIVLDTDKGELSQTGWTSACMGEVGASNCHNVGGTNLGNFSFLEGRFDNWVYEVHWLENHDCKRCDCHCHKNDDNVCNPNNPVLHLTNVQNCERMEGDYPLHPIDSEWFLALDDNVANVPVLPAFQGKAMWMTDEIVGKGGSKARFILICGFSEEGVLSGWQLRFWGNETIWRPANGWSTLGLSKTGAICNAINASSTCDPFYLRFGNLVHEEESGGYTEFCDPDDSYSGANPPTLTVEVTDGV